MPERSKGTGKTKCRPWSFRFGVWHVDYDPTMEKITVTKSCNHGGGQDPYKVVEEGEEELDGLFYVMHSFFAKQFKINSLEYELNLI
jgi:hypothetical protein